MLSEEEIEKAKQSFKEEIDNEIKVYSLVNDYTQNKTDNHKILFEYIEELENIVEKYEKTVKENIKLKKQVEQLETEKQKLIEKLEEDKKKWQEFHNRVPEVPEYIDYILEILKGEKE